MPEPRRKLGRMNDRTDWIVRRDFPASAEGYDREAVNAHLERIAARVGREVESSAPAAADDELSGAGRLLREQISTLRVEIDRLSAALRVRSATIAQALDQVLAVGQAPLQRDGGLAVDNPQAELVGPLPARAVHDSASEAIRAHAVSAADDDSRAEPTVAATADGGATTSQDEPDVDSSEFVGSAAGDAVDDPSRAVQAANALADARLVALDMALGGSTRAEIEHELAARFDLPDAAGLTDEVFAAIG